MSFFGHLALAPVDPILGIPKLVAADTRKEKVDLSVGTYLAADGAPFVLHCVRKAESLLHHQHLPKTYQPIEGAQEFVQPIFPLIFGKELAAQKKEHLVGMQTVGGTGALRIGGELLKKMGVLQIFLSQPSWANHRPIFEHAGLQVGSYPYFQTLSPTMDRAGLFGAIREIPKKSAILFQVCCHNPTGEDPSREDWKELANLIKKQQLLVFFDFAYQGFGEGMEEDAFPIRLFVEEEIEMLVAYSFAKNMGLYGERVGALALFCRHAASTPMIQSQTNVLIRSAYSNPPLYGARIVSTLLRSTELFTEWQHELKNMRERIVEMRHALLASLQIYYPQKDFSSLSQQKGLFWWTGLSPQQVERLKDSFGIYLLLSGRLNLAGLTTENMDGVAKHLFSS